MDHDQRSTAFHMAGRSRRCRDFVPPRLQFALTLTLSGTVADNERPWCEPLQHSTSSTSPPPTASTTTTPVKPSASVQLGPGASGPAVLVLQQRLASLGYWLGTPDGKFSDSTEQAVYALQKAASPSTVTRMSRRTRRPMDACA